MTIVYDQYMSVVRMTPAQCRAARGLLGWTAADLARAASVSVFTIRNFEEERSVPDPAIVRSMRRAFDGAGIRFDNAAEGVGVSLGDP
jgi:ribosome-binding protein aMBF1 (putative translation factor)